MYFLIPYYKKIALNTQGYKNLLYTYSHNLLNIRIKMHQNWSSRLGGTQEFYILGIYTKVTLSIFYN